MKFNTKTIHAGVRPDPTTGAIMTPIYQTSTYVQDSPGKHKGYEYGRTGNPTRDALQESIAALENGLGAVCFGSGLGAMDALLKELNPGDEIIASNDLYGGSYRLVKTQYEKYGIKSHFIDMSSVENVSKHINENTKLLWIETPTNPTLKIVDIKALCDLAHSKGVKTCVDNTFASPYLQRPIDLGADYVLHSATKFLGGHSDAILGVVVATNQDDLNRLLFTQNAAGAVPGPMDCFLVLRGIKTLHLRVQRACENAREIAELLRSVPGVRNVYYPGFEDHPNHDVAAKQMKDFGAMISFDLEDDSQENAFRILEETQLFSLAESLGGVESLIGHPASMTHGSIPREERLKAGLTDSLIRISVGVEDIEDLKADILKALEVVVPEKV